MSVLKNICSAVDQVWGGQPMGRLTRRPAPAAGLLAIESLSPRIMLAADVGLDVQGEAVPGEAVTAHVWYAPGTGNGSGGRFDGPFGEMFGGVLVAPTATDLSNAIDGVFLTTGFELVGADGDIAATQYYPPSGNRDDVVYFESLLSAQGNGGSRHGIIGDATLTASGVLYVGESTGTFDTIQPTYWLSHSAPSGGVDSLGFQVSGYFSAVSNSGTFVGSASLSAQYGVPSQVPTALPGSSAGAAIDISHQSDFIVGDLIWVASSFGGYDVYNTSNFDFSVSGGAPNWTNVEVDGNGEPCFVGEFFSLTTFDTATGYWDAAGNFLGSYDGISADKAIVAGEIVTGINDNGEGFLVRPRDGATIAVAELLGLESPATIRGLFSTEGALGLVLEDATGIFTAVVETAPTPGGGGGGDPAVADLLVDINSDGKIDYTFEDTTAEDVTFTFPTAGTYNVTVIAVDASGAELARQTKPVVVTGYRVENRDGLLVLMIGANQKSGSNMMVVEGSNGDLRVTVDRLRGTVQADVVEIIGSEKADRLTLNGSFAARVNLYGGADRVTAIGLESLEAELGSGNDRSTTNNVGEVRINAGAGNDSVVSIGHQYAFVDLGTGNDSVTSRGFASFLVGGAGKDRLTSRDSRTVVVADILGVSGVEEWDLLADSVFAELGTSSPNRNNISSLLDGLYGDDGDRDSGLVLSGFNVVLQGDKDRLRAVPMLL